MNKVAIERPRTARQYVLGLLRTEILQGRHPPGSRLRQEEVAGRLDVSTTPVREAFRDLVAEGLISLDAHRGAVVRGLTLSDVQEIYQMRIRLEPLLAERTLSDVTERHLAEAAIAHEKMCARPTPEQWAAFNEEFHAALTGNPEGRLAGTVTNLAQAAAPYVVLSLYARPDIMDMNNRDHEELLELYRARNKRGIVKKAAAHLVQTLEAIEQEVELKAAASTVEQA